MQITNGIFNPDDDIHVENIWFFLIVYTLLSGLVYIKRVRVWNSRQNIPVYPPPPPFLGHFDSFRIDGQREKEGCQNMMARKKFRSIILLHALNMHGLSMKRKIF